MLPKAKQTARDLKNRTEFAFEAGRAKGEALMDDGRRHDRGQVQGMTVLLTGAVVLGLTIIVLLLMELISGEFAAAIPASGAFSNAANNTTVNGGTSFNIMGVATLVIPVVVVVGLLIGVLGSFFFGSGGMGGGLR